MSQYIRAFESFESIHPSPNNDAAIHYPRLGTELDPNTGDRSFEALREVESWSNDSVNDVH